MASRSSSAPIGGNPSSVIKRTAIDASGCLGSLYDQYRDQISKEFNATTQKVTIRKLTRLDCKLIRGNTDTSRDLLQMIGIQDDLRMSILLNLVPRNELTSLVDYPHPINEYTRFLHYTCICRKEKFPDNAKKTREQIKSSMHQTSATHIITSISWGIHFVAVLQLPSNDSMVNQIDNVLQGICTNMKARKNNALKLASTDENLLRQIISTKIYSNIPAMVLLKTICDIYANIYQFETNKIYHRPIDFKLCSIQETYVRNNKSVNTLNHLYDPHYKQIEQYLMQLLNTTNYFKSFLIDNVSDLLREHLNEQIGKAYMKWLDIKKKYADEIERYTKLVVDLRHDETQIFKIEHALNDEQQKTLIENINELTKHLKCLEAKEQLIINLKKQHFQYWDVTGCGLNECDNEKIVQQTLIKDERFDRVLCSNDTLNENKSAKFNQLCDELFEERQKNTDLRLFYADFSYCSFKLSDIIIFPQEKMNKTNVISNHIASPRPVESQISATSPDEIINILLLGESGVGKSTFINAFVNYLRYKTLKDAESNKPLVVIPVSFLITVGNNFDEHMVKFGGSDNTNNEDFDHPGQSVTQRCKSYVFKLDHIHGKKLRIIDTPGFGDTRGLNQDDLNMQHILEYINNLPHLNAVCFLLKPNVARLNNYFRTCVTQLLDLLGPLVRHNIIFCFTNGRCSFYSPGDTAPLLRSLLNSFPVKDIPFTKTNTFCLDSESFRYLVTLQKSIQFSELDRDEYEKSWNISATESNRLINYVCKNQVAYNIGNKWKSNRHAHIEIIRMIRPILEEMRNTLRNIILFEMNIKDTSIQLISKAVDAYTTVCLSCPLNSILICNLWINPDDLHGCVNKCLMCNCAPDQHIPIDYILRYETSNNPPNHNINEMIDQVSLLLNASVEFARFLKSTIDSSKEDRFLDGLKRMIQEETQICAEKKTTRLNIQLLKKLQEVKRKYECRMNEMKPNQNNIELPVIYERIRITQNYSGIHEQMDAVKKGQASMMKYYEHEISNDHMNDSVSLSTDF